MWCGDDDLILDHSIRFDKYLTELGVEHKYEQSAGDHSWGFWDLHIQDGLRFLLK
jgi:S-formylglutathione hydrolase FrmB